MSAATWTGPIACFASFIAANTGRSGQPMQKFGGRGGSGASSTLATSSRRSATPDSHASPSASESSGARRPRKADSPRAIASTEYSPARGSGPLPSISVAMPARRRIARISCSTNSGLPSSSTSTARLPSQNETISSGTSGCTTLSTRIGSVEAPNASASPNCASARTSEL